MDIVRKVRQKGIGISRVKSILQGAFSYEICYAKEKSKSECNMRDWNKNEKRDAFGLEELEHKTSEEMLHHIIEKKCTLNQVFEMVSEESGFRTVFDNRQMGQDFWVYSFGVLLEKSNLDKNQKVSLMQLMMEIFLDGYPYTAQLHYSNLENNVLYRNYLEKCFGIGADGVRFWILLGAMSGNAGERSEETLTFTNEYMKFMSQLELYLSIVFTGRGFGHKIQEYLIKLLKLTADRTQQDLLSIFSDISVLNNPLTEC